MELSKISEITEIRIISYRSSFDGLSCFVNGDNASMFFPLPWLPKQSSDDMQGALRQITILDRMVD